MANISKIKLPNGSVYDLIDVTSGYTKNTGTVTTTGTMTSGHVVVSNGNTVIKDSGFTIAKSVPSDAKFTDTTYSDATESASGLMPAKDKVKANKIYWINGSGTTAGT